ncbi:hypothetical protein CEXT_237141 [Caerostris extrusa]|uniref:Uncharacterized protein n=1 Tax=Caerostris extrusa TaxID=172846 RepID=A0AAV4U0Y0_CAEEX|nr:hypothetical protein CEXT_237141 [Caerostris extrusa]
MSKMPHGGLLNSGTLCIVVNTTLCHTLFPLVQWKDFPVKIHFHTIDDGTFSSSSFAEFQDAPKVHYTKPLSSNKRVQKHYVQKSSKAKQWVFSCDPTFRKIITKTFVSVMDQRLVDK